MIDKIGGSQAKPERVSYRIAFVFVSNQQWVKPIRRACNAECGEGNAFAGRACQLNACSATC